MRLSALAGRGLAATTLLGAALSPAHAQLLIDSFDSDRLSGSIRGAGNSPLALVTVDRPTDLGAIGVRVDLDSPGNLRFVIFDAGTSSLLFASKAQAFADDGIGYKVSAPFSRITLQKGIVYAIGGVADVGGRWSFEDTGSPDDVANGITVAGSANENVGDFAHPALIGAGSANIHIQLYGTAPEPSSLSLLALGVVAVARRRRS